MSTVFLKKLKNWKEKEFCCDMLHKNKHIHDKNKTRRGVPQPGRQPQNRHRGAGKKSFRKNKARQAGQSCLQ